MEKKINAGWRVRSKLISQLVVCVCVSLALEFGVCARADVREGVESSCVYVQERGVSQSFAFIYGLIPCAPNLQTLQGLCECFVIHK